MTNLAGLHDRESVELGITGTWTLDTIALVDKPAPKQYEAGYEWICRANWGYGSTGTLPLPAVYGEYLTRLAAYVRGSQGCHRWIVGNEPNLSREWPESQPIFPWLYADCYKAARRTIHAIPGHERDEVLIAAPGPWNAELKYPGNVNGDWIKYFLDVINTCYDEIDGFAIHSYTHGYQVALVTSEARMQAPFQSRHYEFRSYRDYVGAIPDNLRHLPVYMTEANGNGPWQAAGLMPAMLAEIDAWNRVGKIPVQCVIFYRYPKYDQYAIEGKRDVIDEYKAAIGRGYTSPVGNTNAMPQTTLLPHVVNQTTSALPREWDPRLTERGVTVETPALAPGQQYWRVAKARWFSEAESQGRHHIYIEAPEGTAWRVTWPSGSAPGYANGRSGFDASNFPMSKSLNEFSVQIRGDMDIPSETVRGIGMGANGNSGIHTSTLVAFQLATAPQKQEPAKPPVPATVPPLAHPIANPEQRVISQRFGDNPSAYARFGLAGHNGVDYAVPVGTPVRAVAYGRVLESRNDPDGYGEYVKVWHPWGESLYAHLKRQTIGAGKEVVAGEIIGMSGNTGNSTGPHLHFAMRVHPYQRGYPYDGFSDPSGYLINTPPVQPLPMTDKKEIIKAIGLAALEFDVDPDLLLSQAWAESSLDPRASSPAGAQGLFQIMPSTWAEWSPKIGAGNDPFDPYQNARVGARYLKEMLKMTGGNPYQALIAYGWGPGNWQSDKPRPDAWVQYANKIVHGRDLLKAVG